MLFLVIFWIFGAVPYQNFQKMHIQPVINSRNTLQSSTSNYATDKKSWEKVTLFASREPGNATFIDYCILAIRYG